MSGNSILKESLIHPNGVRFEGLKVIKPRVVNLNMRGHVMGLPKFLDFEQMMMPRDGVICSIGVALEEPAEQM